MELRRVSERWVSRLIEFAEVRGSPKSEGEPPRSPEEETPMSSTRIPNDAGDDARLAPVLV